MGESDRAFVLLRHKTTAGVHWDLMLEVGQSLSTWQLAQDPTRLAKAAIAEGLLARRLPDHRLAYLAYEGPLSDNRGEVVRVDRGRCELVTCESGLWTFRLTGRNLSGCFQLEMDKSESPQWHLTKVD